MNLRTSDIFTVPTFLATVAGTATALGCHTLAISGIQTLHGKDDAWLRRRASLAQLFWTDATFRYAQNILGISVILDIDERTEERVRINPLIIISNHQSLLDIPFIARLSSEYGCTDLRWILKREIERWPFIGYSCRLNGSAFVDRDPTRPKRDLVSIRNCAETTASEKASIAVFPEGTRFRTPDLASPYRHVLPPHPAAVSVLVRRLQGHAVCSLTLCHKTDSSGQRMLFARMRAYTHAEIGFNVRAWLDAEWRDKEAFVASTRGS